MNKERGGYFEYLAKKYRSNDLTPEEFEEFIRLLSEEGDVAEGLDRISQEDWKESKKVLENIRIAQHRQNRRKNFRRWTWSSAAAVVLLLGCVWLFWPQDIPENIFFHTGYGETKNIELPDGSKVLLNANSKIIWNGAWEKEGLRSVVLEGEAFFDVVKIDAVHFEVNTSDLKVDVKGTEFNVRKRDGETDVFLHSGKVLLEVLGEASQILEMDPGDFVKFDQQEKVLISSTQNVLQQKASWVDGMLDFQDEKMSEILREFENLYGKTFRVEEDKLLERRLDLSLPYADWDLIQKALEIALGVKFTVMEEAIIVE